MFADFHKSAVQSPISQWNVIILTDIFPVFQKDLSFSMNA